MSHRISRRTLLRGLGGASLSVPLLSALAERSTLAQDSGRPLRFFLMFTGNGQLPSHWLPPSGGETDFTLGPVLEPLAPLREKLLLVHGLNGVKGHSGGMSETTTGWPSTNGDAIPTNGPSIDQLFAARWSQATPLPSMELGVRPANDLHDQTFYSASGLPVPALGSPLGVFQRLFDVTNLDPAVADAQRARQARVLDHVAGDIRSIRDRIGPAARALLDEHLTLVEGQEEALRRPYMPIDCAFPVAPGSNLGLVDTWRAQHDNVVAAFRCDITRVASLRAGGWGGIEEGAYDEIGISAGHHSAAHSGPSDALLGINRFHAEQLGYLLEQLDAVPEGDGTLLDHTVVVWVNELGLGDFNHHSRSNQHVLLAGGARAGLRNGAYFDLGGVDYQHFLFSLTQLLGATDLDRFGHHGTDRIDALFA